MYEWQKAGGTITYYYPEEKRPDTKDDLLSLGFITPSFDAVLVRIDSQGGDMHNDYLQLEIVSSHLEPDILFWQWNIPWELSKHVMKILHYIHRMEERYLLSTILDQRT